MAVTYTYGKGSNAAVGDWEYDPYTNSYRIATYSHPNALYRTNLAAGSITAPKSADDDPLEWLNRRVNEMCRKSGLAA